jgi:cytochrome c-type biogenesis protein CcmF
MLAEIGVLIIFIAFVLAVYATFASAYGGRMNNWKWVESARNAALLVFPLLTIAVLMIVYALLALDFSLAYVVDVSSQSMSPFLRATALWGGQPGSILFWAWLMAGFVAVVLVRKWQRDRELMPYVIAVSMLTTAFFIGLAVFITNPFARLWHLPGATDLITAVFQPANGMPYIPLDGQGLNPLLRHFGMIGHPPTTYLGFTGFVIPFAFAIAALITGKAHEDEWIRTTRRWTLVAWIFLTIGLILGGRWAYDVLGWGGFWGWDPIENAMLMPWLVGTAFLHSTMMTEKRGMLKVWSIILIVLTYSLALFGTFITRTGVIGSVHAFAKSAMGPAFLIFISVTFIGSLVLLFSRLKSLKGEHEMESFVSREAVFMVQNMLFLVITLAVFWGTAFPLISELVTGTKITVGPPYFRSVTGPMFLVLLILMSIAPLMAWRKQPIRSLFKAVRVPLLGSIIITAVWGYAHRMHPASIIALWMVSFAVVAIGYEYWKGMRARMTAQHENPIAAFANLLNRNRRRYGGYLIHLGVIMVAMAFVGDSYFKQETQGTLSVGQRLSVGGYSLQFNGLRSYKGTDDRDVIEASTTLYQGDQPIGDLQPRRDFFVTQQQPSTIAAVYSTLDQDVYVLLVGWEEIGLNNSTFKIYINPLINWAWIGGVVMILGTLIAVWPSGKHEASYVIKVGALQPKPAAGG